MMNKMIVTGLKNSGKCALFDRFISDDEPVDIRMFSRVSPMRTIIFNENEFLIFTEGVRKITVEEIEIYKDTNAIIFVVDSFHRESLSLDPDSNFLGRISVK